MSLRPASRAEVRLLAELARGRERERGLCLVEGPVVLGEALDAGLLPELVAVTADVERAEAALLARLSAAGALVVRVDRASAERVSALDTSPGLVAAASRPRPWSGAPAATGPALVPVLWGLQDPGNVGTLLRSARAFAAAGCLLLDGGADPFGPKVVRASAGAAFGLPCATIGDEAELLAHAAGWELALVVAGTARVGAPGDSHALPGRCLLVLGHETRGPPGLAGARVVHVPHERCVESLNVAVAGSILMADWYREHGWRA